MFFIDYTYAFLIAPGQNYLANVSLDSILGRSSGRMDSELVLPEVSGVS